MTDEEILHEISKLDKITIHCVSTDNEPYEPGRYQICTGWLGGWYLLDTHSPAYRAWKSCINSILFIFVFGTLFLLLMGWLYSKPF